MAPASSPSPIKQSRSPAFRRPRARRGAARCGGRRAQGTPGGARRRDGRTPWPAPAGGRGVRPPPAAAREQRRRVAVGDGGELPVLVWPPFRARAGGHPDVEQPGTSSAVASSVCGKLARSAAGLRRASSRCSATTASGAAIQLGQHDSVGRLDLRARLLRVGRAARTRLGVDRADDARGGGRRRVAQPLEPVEDRPGLGDPGGLQHHHLGVRATRHLGDRRRTIFHRWLNRPSSLRASHDGGRREHHLPIATADLSRGVVEALLREHSIEWYRLECSQQPEGLSGGKPGDGLHNGTERLSAGTQDRAYIKFIAGLASLVTPHLRDCSKVGRSHRGRVPPSGNIGTGTDRRVRIRATQGISWPSLQAFRVPRRGRRTAPQESSPLKRRQRSRSTARTRTRPGAHW